MKKFLILTILAIFIVPLSGIVPLEGQPVWYGQYLGLLFMLFLGATVILWDFNKYLSILTGLCLLSTFFVTNLSPRAVVLLFQLDMACLASYGISKFNHEHRSVILKSIIIFAALQAGLSVLQRLEMDPIFKSIYNPMLDEVVGFSGAKDQFGSYFALLTPTLIYFSPLFFIIALLGLVASKSSFAFVAGVVGGLIYVFFTNRELFVILIIITALLIPFYFASVDILKPADFEVRLDLWKYASSLVNKGEVVIKRGDRMLQITTRPWIGYGFGNFLTIFPHIPQTLTPKNQINCATEKFTHAHNDYIEVFFEMSYIGLGIVLLMIANFVLRFVVSKKNDELVLYFSSICIFLLNALGNFVSHIAVSGMLLILFYGMYEGARRELIG